MENLLSSIVPFLVITGIVIVIVLIVKMKNDGTGVIKEIKDKKVIFLEVTLAAMNLVEALVAASTAQAHGLNYGTRLGMHLVLAFASITIGITYFNQFTQLYDSLKERNGMGVFKNTLDVILATFIVFIPPFINTMFIALNMNAKEQVQAFFTNLLNLRFTQAVFSIQDPTSFVSSMIFIIHVVGIIYLGLYAIEVKVVEDKIKSKLDKKDVKPEVSEKHVTDNKEQKKKELENLFNKNLRRPN